jgi:hypothetical protein
VAIAARAELTRREVLVDRAAAAIELAERAFAQAVTRNAEVERRQYAEAHTASLTVDERSSRGQDSRA